MDFKESGNVWHNHTFSLWEVIERLKRAVPSSVPFTAIHFLAQLLICRLNLGMVISFLFLKGRYMIVWYHCKGDIFTFYLSTCLCFSDKYRGHTASLDHELHTFSSIFSRVNYPIKLIFWDQGDDNNPQDNNYNTQWTLKSQKMCDNILLLSEKLLSGLKLL